MKLHMMFLVAAACSANVEGDDTGGPGVGNDEIRFRITAVADERADQIDFATGEPVHTHAAPDTQLGRADCPDVYKHAYLMATPLFGREVAPNPLAWEIEAKGPAEYRVRAGDATLRDWTPVEGDAIELRRDVVTQGKHLLDVRVGEAVATTCFVFHPLAAPLEARVLEPAPAGLASMTFAAASPLSRLFTPEAIPVFAQTFAHHTAEPIELVIDAGQPAATFTRRAVDEYVALPTINATTACNNADGDLGEPICNDTSAIPASTSETVNGGIPDLRWSLQILDEATNAPTPNCTVTQLRATCHLPAREATAASQRYRLVLALANVRELAPFGADLAIAEHTLAGRPFTGRVLDTKKRCAQFQEVTKFGVTITSCIKETHHVHMQAMDTALMTFAPLAITFTADATDLPPFTLPSFTWDAGDADLPGPQ